MDPDVAAAFGSTPSSTSTSSTISDPDVAAAFGGSGTIHAPPWMIAADKPIQGLDTAFRALPSAVNRVMRFPGDVVTTNATDVGLPIPIVAGLATAADYGTASLLGGREPAVQANEAVHPLQEAADAEQSRLDTMSARAQAKGLELPDKNVSQPQAIANNMAREDLKLPTGAPLTANMLHQANKQYVSPAYDAVAKWPEPIPLSETTKATLADVKPLLPPKEASTLPDGESMSGQQAVDLSKSFRAKANQIPDYGYAPNMQSYASLAQAHRDAATAIENDVRDSLPPQLSDAWDQARIYRAKSGAYEDALDGAGNVQVPKMKRQLLNGAPLSDNAEILANAGASHPELFRGTPATPQPGIVKKAVAGTLPAVLGAAGAHVGPFGAALGVGAGENLANRLLRP